MQAEIRRILDQHGALSTPAAALGEDEDLYAAGLKSFASVQLMLALEEAFDVEFPEHLLNRRTFSSIRAIETALGQIQLKSVA